MPQFNIHWKGCPHHHLPRIRAASPSYGNIQGRSQAHIAAQDVTKLPLGPALDKIRQQQRIKACRRRRGSRGSFGFHITSRRASGRIGERSFNIMAKGAMASAVPYSRKGNRASTCMSGALQIADKDRSEDTNDEGEKLDSRVYCELNSPSSPPETSITRKLSTYSRNRPHNPRLPTKKIRRRTKSIISQSQQSAEWRRSSFRAKPSSSTILSSRGRRHSMRMSQSSSASTVRPIKKVSDMPYRTLSQQKALKVFARELERHLISQEAFRKAGLEKSSTSSSSMSTHSIVELMPYLAEFRAAGLAITSKEQRGADLLKWRTDKPALALTADEPRRKLVGSEILGEELRIKDSPSMLISESISATCTGTASTDSAVIVFASMDGASPSREIATPYPRRISTRKTLPWLRGADARVGFHSQTDNSTKKSSEDLSSSGALTLASMTTIIDFSPEPEKCDSGGVKIEKKTSGLKSTDIKWLDMEIKSNTKDQATYERYGLSGSDCKKSKTSPVATAPKTSGEKPAHLRTDHVFKDIVRNAKVSTTPLSKTHQGQFNAIEDSLVDHDNIYRSKIPSNTPIPSRARNSTFPVGPDTRPSTPVGSSRAAPILLDQQRSPENKNQKDYPTGEGSARSRPELISPPTRSPPLPPLESASFTSSENSILPPTCILDHYEYDRPSVFETMLHQVTTKSHPPKGWYKEDAVSTNKLNAQPSKRRSCDPIKRKSNPLYGTSRADPRTSATTSRSTFKSELTGQSQSTFSTERSVASNKDVFKGLQIALAAACDEDMDAWITEVSGCRVRRFLADLRVFEGLGVNPLVDEAMRTARRRRKKMEAYGTRKGAGGSDMEAAPRSARDGDAGIEEKLCEGQSEDPKVGIATLDMSASASARARQTVLMEEMKRRKDMKKVERKGDRMRRYRPRE